MLNSVFYTMGARLICALLMCGLPVVHRAGREAASPGPIETLRSVAALPPHLTGRFGEPAAFQQAPAGEYFVFDRRGHTVYAIDSEMTTARPVVRIGFETGRLLQPFAFQLGEGEFAVADAPGRTERVQIFVASGSRIAGFSLPSRSESRVQLEGLVLNGVGSLAFTDARTILLNLPETGSLITEYDVRGRVVRSIGALRRTGHETDRELHLAMNAGLPLGIPGGGYYFVFQTGEPRFRRYDARGVLMYERAIQGRPLDDLVQSQPNAWPRRAGLAARDVPVVTPIVRTAAVDPRGQLWVGFTLPVLFVYDRDGEKVRTVELRGAGLLRPTSLFFTGDGRLLVTPGCYIFRP